MAGSSEKQWVRELEPRLQAAMQTVATTDIGVGIEVAYRLAYATEILHYDWESDEASGMRRSGYETDLLIYDHSPDKRSWVPRVVIECKLGSVTTHDALTYSSKAATHKHVHPYLRYGILIGNLGTCVPPRLMRHGAYFDFMAVWQEEQPNTVEWDDLIGVLCHEVRASRILQELLTGKDRSRKRFRLIHRPLRFEPMQTPASDDTEFEKDE